MAMFDKYRDGDFGRPIEYAGNKPGVMAFFIRDVLNSGIPLDIGKGGDLCRAGFPDHLHALHLCASSGTRGSGTTLFNTHAQALDYNLQGLITEYFFGAKHLPVPVQKGPDPIAPIDDTGHHDRILQRRGSAAALPDAEVDGFSGIPPLFPLRFISIQHGLPLGPRNQSGLFPRHIDSR
ncbi:MAG: hypothetical protein BWY09_01791 [Candidatus Hydrogenedentes bacterium ADurb.Bin179]|nr:MAG: hypothetical protein BWY09_01791 [Candidatus Hydrogenedentes bacterium ADurb.Bin179]